MDINAQCKATILIVFMSMSVACGPSGGSTNETLSESGAGYQSLFIGHSFFSPFAESIEQYAHRAGFNRHSQQIFISSGASGAPQAFWEDSSKRHSIQEILDSGKVELFGMTYHPDYPGTDGYKNWVEYALHQNPNTKFFIAVPWAPDPTTVTASVYADVWHNIHAASHNIIDILRSEYPEVDFFCIPYGRAAIELRDLFESGNLSDVQSMVSEVTGQAIFKDSFGHPNSILIDLGVLVWLRAIYGVDLQSHPYDPPYLVDLKTMAQDIMDEHDPGYNLP